MNDYFKVKFNITPFDSIQADILAALLCDIDYESFEQVETGVNAYIKSEYFDNEDIKKKIGEYDFSSSITWSDEFIKGKDWNEEWECNQFKPILIANKCVIHSTNHVGYPSVPYDIVINPKQAFGTGHHETTTLIVEELLQTDLTDKTLLDMGTGTGILAILAHKCGVDDALGIEIDEMAYENALENVALNNADKVRILHGDASLLNNIIPRDIFIANINRNIIMADLDKYAKSLREGGTMMLSGFYENDIPIINSMAILLGLKEIARKTKNNWSLLKLQKIAI